MLRYEIIVVPLHSIYTMKNITQPVLADWYSEAIDYGSPEFKNYSGSRFIIYKGFKITLVDNEYKMEDTRKSDFYSEVTKFDLKFFNKHGFIKACDLLMHKRNILRVKKYTKILERLYEDKQEMLKQKFVDPLKYSNLINGINKYIDLLQTQKSRVSQHNRKYSLPA